MLAFAMHPPRPRHISRRQLSWLLWIAFLLPIAQCAATWHNFSHDVSNASEQLEGKHALHPAHCELCSTAAAISGGALLGTPPAWAQSRAHHGVPDAPLAEGRVALLTQAYRSRAPPFA
jgi:hypothetical protein